MLIPLLLASTLTIPGCLPETLAIKSAQETAKVVEGKMFLLVAPHEIARYKDIVDQIPPPSGPADKLIFVVTDRTVLVIVAHQGSVCEHFTVKPEIHERAWTNARGQGI